MAPVSAYPTEQQALTTPVITPDFATYPTGQQAYPPLQVSVVKSGLFFKEGGFVKSWKRRWFLLDNNALRYYVPSNMWYRGNPHGGNWRGTIPLHRIARVWKSGKELHIATYGGRVYRLQPEAMNPEVDEVISSWLLALQHNIGLRVQAVPHAIKTQAQVRQLPPVGATLAVPRLLRSF
jgi:hypothetical protein